MAEAKQVDLEDSNIAGIGSDADKAARKAAAQSDPEWANAGTAPGLEIWRVENRRTENDTPDFGVKRWPEEDFGKFYSGDSYIVMKTIADEESGKLSMDVHFWLGESTTQDEMGVAAYKTVELDDLLDGVPVQYREVQHHESGLFQSYFPQVQYMEGGIASGFRHVTPEEYKPRLFQIRRTKRTIRVVQVECTRDSLNHGDAFVLDAGLKVYQWNGDSSSPFEKQKAGSVASKLIGERNGKASAGDPEDDAFWEVLGGRGDVQGPVDREPEPVEEFGEKVLYRLSDESGTLQSTEVARGTISRDQLVSSDVFIVDVGPKIFVWVGSGASDGEKRNAMKTACNYLTTSGRPMHTPITRVVEGAREAADFASVFA